MSEKAGFTFAYNNQSSYKILTGSYSNYIKRLIKNGMTIEECFRWFSKNNIKYFITDKKYSDDIIKEHLDGVFVDKKIMSVLYKKRPALYCDVIGKYIKNKITDAIVTLPEETRYLIENGVITIKTEISYDKDSVEMLLSVKDI